MVDVECKGLNDWDRGSDGGEVEEFGGWEVEDCAAVAGAVLGDVICPFLNIEYSRSSRKYKFGCVGKSRLGNSLGNRSLRSSALLIGMIRRAILQRSCSVSGWARMMCVIHVAKPEGVRAGTVGRSFDLS